MDAHSTSPLAVGRRLALVAPGSPPAEDGRIAVRVPRGAFGSGEHETTAACLEALERIATLRGARVLDLGSGTGVLGVAAVLLGADSATCIDVDAGAVSVSRRTAALNEIADRVACIHGDISAAAPGPFEVVLANVYADVLLEVAAVLVGLAAPRAVIVLSGIAWEQEYAVRRAYQSLGSSVAASRWGEEWVTLTLAAPGTGVAAPGPRPADPERDPPDPPTGEPR